MNIMTHILREGDANHTPLSTLRLCCYAYPPIDSKLLDFLYIKYKNVEKNLIPIAPSQGVLKNEEEKN